MTLTVDGYGVHVVERGTGAPVLFLHGNPDSSEVWADVIERMAGRFRCLAPDLPGFGQSQEPEVFDCSLEGMAAWVDGVVTALRISEPLHLVVHDFGGLFGLAWASTYPDRVRRMGIMNTAFFPEYRWHFWARVWRTPLLGELSFALNSRRSMALEMRRGSKKLPQSYAWRAYDSLTPSKRRMILRLYRATDPGDFAPWQDRLRALMTRTPACVLWGDRDRYIQPDFAERFGAAEIHHFADAGHWLAIEQPAAVAERLLAFFGA